ncbi:unnamed protein product [Urochloa humidicola]
MEGDSSAPAGSRSWGQPKGEGSTPSGGRGSPVDRFSLGSSAGTGTFSCFHGEKEKRPPVKEATLRDANEIRRRFIDGFYKEAARRLPLEEMPGLDGCICSGGLCIGPADPVSNIILNAVGLLLHDQQEQAELPPPQRKFRVRRDTQDWVEIAYRSLRGLRGFMTSYFRYLGATQAARYLYLASHNLPLAIRLVHHDRFGPKSYLQELRLLPDGGKFKAALRIAAVQSKHPAPDLLAQLMTAQYPPELLSHVLAKLQGTELLTAGDVSEIMDLLDRQWPPAAPPVNMEFWCRPNGTTCTRGGGVELLISACIEENLIAEIKISTDPNYYRFKCISDFTFHCEDMEAKLSDCLQAAGGTSGMKTTVKYEEFRCEHTVTLEVCLLDTIYAFYIKALAILPSSPCLLRALLVAGHCYGPMDPVSNIILNTVWYDIAFPLPEDAKVELPRGILDTRPMFRLASHSLDGLVEMVLGYCSSRHEALQYLNSFDCNLYHEFLLIRGVSYSAFNYNFVAKAAKHPQHAAHGKFLMSLPLDKMVRLRELLLMGGGTWFSFRESVLNAMPVLAQKEEAPDTLSPLASMEISRKKTDYKDKLTFVCGELEKVLQKYCHQHPWEPTYKLVTVCGVRESRSPRHPNFYHANFLASTDTVADDIISFSEFRGQKLFFAEFWVPPFPEDVESKPSSCCPVYNYRACTGPLVSM